MNVNEQAIVLSHNIRHVNIAASKMPSTESRLFVRRTVASVLGCKSSGSHFVPQLATLADDMTSALYGAEHKAED